MFSGIGGFENGIGDRLECVGYSEIDKYAQSIYRKHFPDHINYGDATQIRAEELPDFDLLVGGFPCQAFSVAGKQRGFCDTRGTLFFEIARILTEKRPRYILLENVKGLLSHDKGKTFQTIIGVLTDIGYRVQWQVLNSKDFGVPQNRERVFIVGHLGGERGREVFPIFGNAGETLDYLGAIISDKHKKWLEDGKELSRNHSAGMRVYSSNGISSTLCGNAGGLGGKTRLYALPTTSNGDAHYIDSNYHKGTNELNKGRRTQVAVPVLTPDRENKRQNGRRFKTDGEPAFTCTAQDKHGVYDGYRIRRLTPIECERLQGFPDGYTKYGVDDVLISDTQRYKCLGNAVSVPVIAPIIDRLL
jgi:DNA (cytosine-5)-methyltransferase 1